MNPNEATYRVTEQDVWDVANSLWVKKIDPSTNKIRDLLGRGSNRTILMHLETWRQKEWEQPCADDPLWQELTKIRKKVEHQSNTAALKKIQEIQEECGNKIIAAQLLQQTIQLEREDLAKELQNLQVDFEKLDQEHQTLNLKFKEEEKKRYEAELSSKHLEKEILEHTKQAHQQLSAQSNEYEQKIKGLQEQIKKIEQHNESGLSKLNEEYKQHQQKSQERIFALQGECMKYEKKIHVLEHSEKSYQEKLQMSENLRKEDLEKLQKLENENQDLLKQKHSGEIKLATLEAQFQQLEKINIEQKLQLKEVHSALLVQKEHSGKLEEKLHQLQLKEKKSNENKKTK